ncbi:hypothetical protein ACFXG4_35565 [Nocardia sp. NPDC059246]|uniref:hypothetical protein n=1 Tax=unclassified Nocardia TaxID=2637762 RepID=UPI0036BDE2B5
MIFALAFTGIPTLLWALAARTWMGRLVGAAVLGVLMLAEWAAGNGWFGNDLRDYGPMGLAAVGIVVAVAAPFAELPLTRNLGEESRITKVRMFFGHCVGLVYSGLTALLLAGMLILGLLVTKAPAADAILLLPSPLVMISTENQGCTSGDSTDACTRAYSISGPGTPEEIAARIEQHLHDTYGCSPLPSTSLDWFSPGCRTDRFETASVYIRNNTVRVYLRNLTDFL